MAALTVAVYTAAELLLDDDDIEDGIELEAAFLVSAHLREDRIKTEKYFEMTVPNYLPDEFKRFFKIHFETYEVLCRHLGQNDLLRKRIFSGGRIPVPLEKKILMTLRYLASTETIRSISDRFDVTDSTFLLCKNQVFSAIGNSLLQKFIHWPHENDLQDISENFDSRGTQNFPNVIGAVDGCHISIEAPTREPNAYYNRKKFHSVILQAVCIDNLSFTHINAGWPGRVHDAKVIRHSALWDEGFSLTKNGQYHILGDCAYPLKQWLLTPYRDNGHLTRAQSAFNKALSSKRQVIERAFGLLKGRFRRLKHVHCKSVEGVCAVICSACVIHNICIAENDVDIDELIFEDEENVEEQVMNNQSEDDTEGVNKRQVITNMYR